EKIKTINAETEEQEKILIGIGRQYKEIEEIENGREKAEEDRIKVLKNEQNIKQQILAIEQNENDKVTLTILTLAVQRQKELNKLKSEGFRIIAEFQAKKQQEDNSNLKKIQILQYLQFELDEKLKNEKTIANAIRGYEKELNEQRKKDIKEFKNTLGSDIKPALVDVFNGGSVNNAIDDLGKRLKDRITSGVADGIIDAMAKSEIGQSISSQFSGIASGISELFGGGAVDSAAGSSSSSLFSRIGSSSVGQAYSSNPYAFGAEVAIFAGFVAGANKLFHDKGIHASDATISGVKGDLGGVLGSFGFGGGDDRKRALEQYESENRFLSFYDDQVQSLRVSSQIQEEAQRKLDGAKDIIKELSHSIGIDLSPRLSELRTGIRGTSDVLADYVNRFDSEIVKGILPGFDAFSRAGESLAQTVDRINQSAILITSTKQSIDGFIASIQGTSNTLTIARQQIDSLFDDLSGTTDVQERISLESQLSSQIIERYKLEEAMLDSMKSTIDSVLINVSTAQLNVSAGRESIVGRSILSPAQILEKISANFIKSPQNNIQSLQSIVDFAENAKSDLSIAQSTLGSAISSKDYLIDTVVNSIINGFSPGGSGRAGFNPDLSTYLPINEYEFEPNSEFYRSAKLYESPVNDSLIGKEFSSSLNALLWGDNFIRDFQGEKNSVFDEYGKRLQVVR
ncbi:MAG: hypothetical protein HON94_16645, partial [Methylococcales bacterium]|nr:hypothetical protein [Methylococcales bacterium]